MQKSNGFLATLENCVDILLTAASMALSYILTAIILGEGAQLPKSEQAIVTMFLVAILQSCVFMATHMYAPIPLSRPASVLFRLFRVLLTYYLGVAVFFTLTQADQARRFSLVWVCITFIICTAVLIFKKRMIIRASLLLRRRRYNIRKVIIVGNNTLTASEFIEDVSKNPESGMVVIGYVGDKKENILGCDWLGSFSELGEVLDRYHPHDVVFAIDIYNRKRLISLVNLCDDRCVKVYFLPVIHGYFKSPKQIETIGALPLINIHSTPLDTRWNAFIKRVMDIVGSLALIILTSPIMLFAAIGVYITSPGPILFRQERIGMMGKPFKILKFRSMKVNVASSTAWTTGGDPRKTRFGNFLRTTSIDELPQLFNVLAGSMSLVGPRPEVPKFVDYFRQRIPLYMVKHYVKPGITGLAQIKGLRGDTSIPDRIDADIEYIENWSLGLDILILLKTPLKAFNKQEAAPKDERENEDLEDDGLMKDVQPIVPELTETEEVGSADKKASKGKILYAASTMSHINNFHLDYISALRDEGYEVKVMARGEDADYAIPFEKKFISPENSACRVEIRKILEKERFDIILLNTSLAAYQIRRCLPKEHRPKVVNFVHGYLFSKDVGLARRLMLLMAEKVLASKTDRIIVMNEQDRVIAEKNKLCLGPVSFCRGMGATVREQVVPADKLRHELGCDDRFVMAFVGELSGRKNQEFLIYALNRIRERIPGAVLWLIGDGIAKDELMALASRVDVSESVFLLGRKENACDFMRACDLYVSASTIEGMPFNLIEAMGCAKTVLASSVKGHVDLIEDGVSGFLYKAGDEKDFADKVVAIHDGELALNEEDIVARYRNFSKEQVFSETLEILRESFK